MLTSHWGDAVIAEAEKLRANGLDANQIAGILCKKDPQGKNFGIGIMLGPDGKPMKTSATLLEYATRELQESATGTYLNSDALKKELLEAVLAWQGVPEAYATNAHLLLPSDAGTGAVQTAIQAACLIKEGFITLAVEKFGWPAYKALAASCRLKFQEFETDGMTSDEGVLPIYQAGPMNTTGKVPSPQTVSARAAAAKAARIPVVLDRAYSGFEYARRLGTSSYQNVMRDSFAAQVLPFLQAGVPVCVAISPTKAFVTFSLRPCGLLLVLLPDSASSSPLAQKLTGLIRARGSSFEHPLTRAFVKALVKERSRLEAEHATALERVAQAENQWQTLTRGTPMEPLFSEAYAGLFRNPLATAEAPRELYNAHLYPVFSEGRCRLNVTGLPQDPSQAAQCVREFSRFCR